MTAVAATRAGTPKPNVTVLSARAEKSFTTAERDILAAAGQVRYISCLEPLPPQTLASLAPETEVLALTRRATRNLDEHWLGELPALRGITVYSTGYEWIDVPSLTAKGIQVAYLPGYSTAAVAEHTLGMLLTLSRRLHLSHAIGSGHLPRGISMRGWELNGKTVGIIGLGRIGRAIAKLCTAFGMHVIGHDPAVQATDWTWLPLDQLLARSQILIVAASQRRTDPPLVDRAALSLLPRGAWLVNPSRPGLVDSQAALEALHSAHLLGYAVDDYVFEPGELQDLEPGRLLQTLHTAWYSDEAMARGTAGWARRIAAMAQGAPVDLVPSHDGDNDG
ncbi:MAG TPA: NAD(P)-dependent oxidoreductase [Gammaproteobacteria bacterium]|nr:NAD(P)-dependent oxidoreductase [Gammaproteobacteria bacterium]